MSYVRDRDRFTRGVGAIAALDAGDRRRLAQRQLRANMLRARERALARFTYGHPALGAINQGQPVEPTAPGSLPGGGGGRPPGGGGSDGPYPPVYHPPVVYQPPPMYPTPPRFPTRPGLPPTTGTLHVPTTGGIVVDPLPPPVYPGTTPVLPTNGTISGGGGGGGGGIVQPPTPPGMEPPDAGPPIPDTPHGLDMGKIALLGAVGVGLYLLLRKKPGSP
jgi:hypothetical protein